MNPVGSVVPRSAPVTTRFWRCRRRAAKDMRIKCMFIVQRYVYRAKVRLMPADAGGVLHRECGLVAIVGAMRKFRVGWRPNALYPIAERHFGAELVSACHGPRQQCVRLFAARCAWVGALERPISNAFLPLGEGLQMHCKCTM